MLTTNNKNNHSIDIRPKNVKIRPEVTNKTSHREYFEELMFDRVNLCPLPRIKSLNIVIRFDIVEHNCGSWTIVVENGILKRALRNHITPETFLENKTNSADPAYNHPGLPTDEVELKPTCVFRLEGKTFMSIIRREITPQQAFFQKKVQIEGDITLALKMNVLVNYL